MKINIQTYKHTYNAISLIYSCASFSTIICMCLKRSTEEFIFSQHESVIKILICFLFFPPVFCVCILFGIRKKDSFKKIESFYIFLKALNGFLKQNASICVENSKPKKMLTLALIWRWHFVFEIRARRAFFFFFSISKHSLKLLY